MFKCQKVNSTRFVQVNVQPPVDALLCVGNTAQLMPFAKHRINIIAGKKLFLRNPRNPHIGRIAAILSAHGLIRLTDPDNLVNVRILSGAFHRHSAMIVGNPKMRYP